MPHKYSFLPFMMGAVGQLVPSAKVNVTRIIEAVVIAMLAGGVCTWRTTAVLDERMNSMAKAAEKHELNERELSAGIKTDIKENRDDIKKVQQALDEHILNQIQSSRAIKKSLSNVDRVPWNTN